MVAVTNQFGAWKANHSRLPVVKRGTATRRLAMARAQGRRVRAGIGAAVAAAGLSALTLVAPTPAGAGGDWTVTAAEVRAGYRPAPTTVPLVPSEPEPAATAATTKPPVSEAVVEAGKSPAGRAGADPAGGIPSEVVAWLMGFGVLLVVWCLAWRWRPQETRMVVRQGNGQHGAGASDDDPRRVQIKL
jgi:hypothetical protein